MINSMMDGHQFITVAVALDERSRPLVDLAADLCRRVGKKLHLTHVVEPWPLTGSGREAGAPLFAAKEAVEEGRRGAAARHLDELARVVPDLTVTTSVVVGKPVERLGREAAAVGSCLLVVGAGARPQRRLLPHGYSTASSLMVAAPVPVLAIDPATTARLPERELGVLIADDLSPQSEAALGFAFDLAAAYGHEPTLYHLHVNGLSLENLRAGLETAAAAARTAFPQDREAELAFDALLAQYKDELGQRAAALRDYLEEAGGTYAPMVRTGQIRGELALVVKTQRPDVLVFGRHHAVYVQPFSLGRMPYGAMMSYDRPVIVVPAP